MKRKHSVKLATAESKSGFTMREAVFAAAVLLLFVLVPIGEARRQSAHADVAECLRHQARIAKRLWGAYSEAGQFPADATEILGRTHAAGLENAFVYEVIGEKQGAYYLRCQHDHSPASVIYCDSGAELEPKPVFSASTARGSMQ